jgi:hypothetical protein
VVGPAPVSLRDDSENSLFDGDGVSARANVFAELRPWFAIGPDAGMAWFGDGGNIRHAAVAVRGTWSGSPWIAPYISGQLGAYQSTGPSLEYLGGALSAGLRVTPVRGGRGFIDVEARRSRNAQNIAPMRMRSLSIGGGIYW